MDSEVTKMVYRSGIVEEARERVAEATRNREDCPGFGRDKEDDGAASWKCEGALTAGGFQDAVW